MDDEIRRRSACDRCHSQKLRCPKRQGAEICERCAKAGTSCIYSPFRPKKDSEKTHNGGISLSECHDPVLEHRNEELSKTSKHPNAHKRKCITPPSPETSFDPALEPCSTSAQPEPTQAAHFTGYDWCSNASTIHDLLDDSTFSDMNFEHQSEYPALEFNLPPLFSFTDHGDKINNLLRFRSPPPTIGSSLDGGPFGRPFSPLAIPNPSPSPLAVALQAPRLQLGAGDVRRYQESVSQCIRQLSELSVSLYEHSVAIPPQSIHDPVPENESYVDVMNVRAQDYTHYKVDDTFRLTQELVDIYPSFIDIFTRRKIFQASRSNQSPMTCGSEKSDDPTREPLGPIAPSLSNPLALDHSSILLILSCHLRLIEIYDELFKHMQACIEKRGEICTAQETFTSPQLKIGNYVPPVTASIPMQMLLLFHFATSLCDHAAELEGNIREPEDGMGSSRCSPDWRNADSIAALSLSSAKKVKDRAKGMLQHLSSVRASMLREGLIA